MGIINGGRHQFRRFGASITEHDTLIACAFFLIGGLAGINALRNISRLRMQQNFDIAIFPMEAVLFITDITDGHAGRVGDQIFADRDRTTGFTGNHHLIGGGKGFASRPDIPW